MPSASPTPAELFRCTLELFDTGVEIMRQNLRRQYPALHDDEVLPLLGEWLQQRPGAESGDSSGRAIPVDRFK